MLVAIIFFQYFYNLAKEFNKSAVRFGLLGAAIFIVCQFVFQFLIAFIDIYIGTEYFNESNELLLGVSTMPLSSLVGFLVYRKLKKQWGRGPEHPDVLDDQLMD